MSKQTVLLLIFVFYYQFCLSTNAEEKTQEKNHCGAYGFRCINSNEYEVCESPLMLSKDETGTESPHIVISRTCSEGLTCDEDNPSFCTPSEENYSKCGSKKDRRYVFYDAPDDVDVRNEETENDPTEIHEDHYDINLNFIEPDDGINNWEMENDFPTSTETSDVLCMKYDNKIAALFSNGHDCERIGYFPDNSDKTLFYYCDIEPDGATYTLHHMKCDMQRVFDPIKRECVLIGSTRNI